MRLTIQVASGQPEVEMLNNRYALTSCECTAQSAKVNLTDYEFSRNKLSMKTLTHGTSRRKPSGMSSSLRRCFLFFCCRSDDVHSVPSAALPPPPSCCVLIKFTPSSSPVAPKSHTLQRPAGHVGSFPFISKRLSNYIRFIGPYGIWGRVKARVGSGA